MVIYESLSEQCLLLQCLCCGHFLLLLYEYYLQECFQSFFFLGRHLQHMEVPRLGVKSELQLPAYAAATATHGPFQSEIFVDYGIFIILFLQIFFLLFPLSQDTFVCITSFLFLFPQLLALLFSPFNHSCCLWVIFQSYFISLIHPQLCPSTFQSFFCFLYFSY